MLTYIDYELHTHTEVEIIVVKHNTPQEFPTCVYTHLHVSDFNLRTGTISSHTAGFITSSTYIRMYMTVRNRTCTL